MNEAAIHIKNLSIGFGQRLLLSIDHLEVKYGELTALIGRNGVGKSSLLKMLSGLSAVEKSKVFIQGKDIVSLSPIDLAKELAFVYNVRQSPPALRVQTVVEMGRFAHGDSHTELGQRIVAESMQALGIESMCDYRIDLLSDGEFQKVSIARAIAQKTSVLLLDEPTAFLDYVAREELIQHLQKWAREKNIAILFTSHDIDLVKRYADRIWEIEQGNLIIRSSC